MSELAVLKRRASLELSSAMVDGSDEKLDAAVEALALALREARRVATIERMKSSATPFKKATA